jgi:hypothetical protein
MPSRRVSDPFSKRMRRLFRKGLPYAEPCSAARVRIGAPITRGSQDSRAVARFMPRCQDHTNSLLVCYTSVLTLTLLSNPPRVFSTIHGPLQDARRVSY